MSAALDIRRRGSSPASASDGAQASYTAMLLSTPRPPCTSANLARRGSHSQGVAAKQHPVLLWTGLAVPRATVFTAFAVRFSNGEHISRLKPNAAIVTCCPFLHGGGKLAFLFRHKRGRVRDRTLVHISLFSTLWSGPRLLFDSLAARGFHLENTSAERCDCYVGSRS